jgi:gag-polyprotein putative aspartyl protease
MSRFIDARHDTRRLIIPIIVLRSTPSTDLTGVNAIALVDTGSTTTGITQRIAQELELVPKGKRPMATAQGEGQSERYLFRVAISPDRLRDEPPAFPFVFGDLVGFELTPSFHFDALIGMDILSQCDFEMHRGGACRLSFS